MNTRKCVSTGSFCLSAAPFWLEKPVDLVLAPEENGALVCRSDGIPRPAIRWFINGESLESRLYFAEQSNEGLKLESAIK